MTQELQDGGCDAISADKKWSCDTIGAKAQQKLRLWVDDHTCEPLALSSSPAPAEATRRTLELFTGSDVSVAAIPPLRRSGHVTRSRRGTCSLVGPVLPFVEVLTHMFPNRSRGIRLSRLDPGQQLSRDQSAPSFHSGPTGRVHGGRLRVDRGGGVMGSATCLYCSGLL